MRFVFGRLTDSRLSLSLWLPQGNRWVPATAIADADVESKVRVVSYVIVKVKR